MRKLVCLILAAFLLLAGCTGGTGSVGTTAGSTVPNQSPMEMLGQCVAKTLTASSFVLEYALGEGEEDLAVQFSLEVAKDTRGGYLALLQKSCGCAVFVSGNTKAVINCEDESVVYTHEDDYVPLSALLVDLPALEKQVLERFCNMSLTATPRANGGMEFCVSGLNETEMEALLGVEMETAAEFDGYFILGTDAGGSLVLAEYSLGPMIHRISLTGINQKLDIQKPDWA